jgi:hypothetical protein
MLIRDNALAPHNLTYLLDADNRTKTPKDSLLFAKGKLETLLQAGGHCIG